MELTGKERRRTTRFASSIPIGIRFSKGPDKEGWGRILNISAVGLLVESRFRIKVADAIYVSFSLKDGAKFENLRCLVIRSIYEEGYFLVGLAFDDVVDKETLGDVLAALSYEGGIVFS